MWVDLEFYELYKQSGIPSSRFTKKIAREYKKKMKDFDEVFRI